MSAICDYCFADRDICVPLEHDTCPMCGRMVPSVSRYAPSDMVIVARVNRAAEKARLRANELARLTALVQLHGPQSVWAELLADTLRS